MNTDSPQFLIVAGPNGAGKSTSSRLLSPPGAVIFDPDKELARIAAKFPNLPAESVSYSFQQYFLDCVDNAIKKRAHFVLETNFRDHHLMDSVTRFKDSGYQLTYFIWPCRMYYCPRTALSSEQTTAATMSTRKVSNSILGKALRI